MLYIYFNPLIQVLPTLVQESNRVIDESTGVSIGTVIAIALLAAAIVGAWIRMELRVGALSGRIDNNDNLDKERSDSLNKTMTEISTQLTKYGEQIEEIKNELHSINTYITTEKAVKEELDKRKGR